MEPVKSQLLTGCTDQQNQNASMKTNYAAQSIAQFFQNDNATVAELSRLPRWLQIRLASCPRPPRKGIHPWLFFTARRLFAYLDGPAIFESLWTKTRDRGRFVGAKEIKAQIENAGRSLEQPPNGRRTREL